MIIGKTFFCRVKGQLISGSVNFGTFYFSRMDFVENPQIPSYKIIMLGNSTVGKTSILTQLDTNTFDPEPKATIGGSFIEKTIVGQQGPVKLQLWDTAGQEQFRCLVPIYSRGAAAAVIVLDVSSPKSFESFDEWYELVNRDKNQECEIFVAANKNDLECVVDMEEVQKWAEKHNARVFSTSAKDRKSIDTLFDAIASTKFRDHEFTTDFKGPQDLNRKSKGCC